MVNGSGAHLELGKKGDRVGSKYNVHNLDNSPLSRARRTEVYSGRKCLPNSRRQRANERGWGGLIAKCGGLVTCKYRRRTIGTTGKKGVLTSAAACWAEKASDAKRGTRKPILGVAELQR